jgi:hypothetical protein
MGEGNADFMRISPSATALVGARSIDKRFGLMLLGIQKLAGRAVP